MAWLLRQTVRPSAPGVTWIEHCYDEVVTVIGGRALVQHQATVTYLHGDGYDVVTELPPLDDLPQHPELCAELAKQGLGPWAGNSPAELKALVGSGA